mmetsp:Transcript_33708/g.34337  ORF Transcript_33708/g.34337 Transcript_33708/m.34337 type:complete len:174 (+) Transcript_33708:145-666(+)
MKLFIAFIFVILLKASAFKLPRLPTSRRRKILLHEVPLELTGQLDPEKKWTVKFLHNDEEKELEVNEDTSLLEAAEKYFSDAPSSCRNGVCTTCSAKILAGRENVKLAVHGFGENIINEGFVCSCQSYAVGPGVTIQLDMYDQVYEIQYGQYEKSYEMKYGDKKKGEIKKGLF